MFKKKSRCDTEARGRWAWRGWLGGGLGLGAEESEQQFRFMLCIQDHSIQQHGVLLTRTANANPEANPTQAPFIGFSSSVALVSAASLMRTAGRFMQLICCPCVIIFSSALMR